jgi:hypothetical protein
MLVGKILRPPQQPVDSTNTLVRVASMDGTGYAVEGQGV